MCLKQCLHYFLTHAIYLFITTWIKRGIKGNSAYNQVLFQCNVQVKLQKNTSKSVYTIRSTCCITGKYHHMFF